MLTFDDLLKELEQTGIRERDLVMVHSSYKSLGGVVGGADTVVDAIGELVTAAPRFGAVFWPSYTVNAWCNHHYFDHDETPGEMGIIPERARLKDGARRTRHPIHNFAIHGPWRPEFLFENIESFDPLGPYGLFHREDGLVISIGVPWNDTISFVHYVEQAAGAAFRRVKNFAGLYVSSFNTPMAQTFRMSVRKTKQHITHVAPLYDEVLVPQGVVKQAIIGQAMVSWFRCQEYFDAVFPLVTDHPELFYYEEDWRPNNALGYYPDGQPVADLGAWSAEQITDSELDGWEELANGHAEADRIRREMEGWR